MTGADLKAAIYNLTADRSWNEDSDSVDSLIEDWAKLAIEEFPSEAISTTVFPLVDILGGNPVHLPDNFASVAYYDVINGDVTTRYPTDNLVFLADNKIIFPMDIPLGNLYYYPIPLFESTYEDIPLNPIFHSCLIYFFYAQYYYQSGEGDIEEHRMADNYMARFERMKEQRINTFMNKVSDADPVKMTDALPKRSRGRHTGSDYYE